MICLCKWMPTKYLASHWTSFNKTCGKYLLDEDSRVALIMSQMSKTLFVFTVFDQKSGVGYRHTSTYFLSSD